MRENGATIRNGSGAVGGAVGEIAPGAAALQVVDVHVVPGARGPDGLADGQAVLDDAGAARERTQRHLVAVGDGGTAVISPAMGAPITRMMVLATTPVETTVATLSEGSMTRARAILAPVGRPADLRCDAAMVPGGSHQGPDPADRCFHLSEHLATRRPAIAHGHQRMLDPSAGVLYGVAPFQGPAEVHVDVVAEGAATAPGTAAASRRATGFATSAAVRITT